MLHQLFRTHRMRLLISLPLLVCTLFAAFVTLVTLREEALQRDTQTQIGTTLGVSLSRNARNFLLTRDYAGLQEVVRDSIGFPGLVYALVAAPDGRIVAHTDPALTGKYLDGLPAASPPPAAQIAPGEFLFPVGDDEHHRGWVRIGFDDRQFLEQRRILRLSAALLVGLSLLLTGLLAYVATGLLNRRLQRLHVVAERVAEGFRSERVGLRGEDEVAVVGRQFDQMLDALGRAEAQINSIIDAIPDGLLVTDADGRILRANQGMQTLFGYAPGELLGQPVEMLVPERFRSEHPKKRQRFVDTDGQIGSGLQHKDFLGRHRDGRELVVNLGFSLLNQGDETRIIVTIRDLSERIRQEQELADLYNHAPCGYHTLSPDGAFLRINDTELAWLGYTRDELLQERRLSDLLTPESLARFSDAQQRLLTGGEISELECDLRRRDGSLLPVLLSATAQRDAAGQVLSLRTVIVDVTRVRRQQETLNRILTAAPMAVRIARTQDHRVLFCNKAFAELLNCSPAEALRRDISRHYVDPEAFARIGQRLRAGESIANELVRLHLPDDPDVPEVWALASYMVIDYDGDPAVLAWLFDVTALQEAKAAAEATSYAKSRFLATMSHEIRTPLNAIINIGHLLGLTALDADQREQLKTIDSASRSLLNQINDILDLAKIEAGEVLVDHTPFTLPPLFADLGHLFLPEARNRGLRLNLPDDLSQLPPALIGDPGKIRQLYINLIGNALKFTSTGQIDIGVEQIAADAGQVLLRFSVSDTGDGIAPDVLARLFQPFVQADASTARLHGGTGLGLSLVRQLARHLGGDADCRSTPGKGSVFWFDLPIELPAPDAATPEPVVQGIRLLLVGNEGEEAAEVTALAAQFGWTCLQAADPAGLLTQLGENPALGARDCAIVLWQAGAERTAIAHLHQLRADLPGGLPGLLAGDGQGRPAMIDTLSAAELGPCALLTHPVNAAAFINALSEAFAQQGRPCQHLFARSRIDTAAFRWLEDLNILAVDDSPMNREVCKRLLNHEGANATLCESGPEAIATYQANPAAFDAVLMDVQMPGMDGYEATRRLHALLEGRPLPIIALTAGVLASERDQALSVGMDDFLSKPIDPDKLIHTLRRHIEASHGRNLTVSQRSNTGNAVATSWPRLAGIDTSAARGRCGDDLAFYQRLLARFADEADEYFAQIEQSVITGKPDEAARLLHRLRGQAGNVGANGVMHCAGDLETLANSGQINTAALASLKNELHEVVTTIRANGSGTEVCETGVSDLDPVRFSNLLEQLAEQNLDALSSLRTLAPALRPRLGDEVWKAVEAAADRLAFREVLSRLEALGP